MLTGTRRETSIQSALHHSLKTRSGMLPRSRTLEESPADTPGRARHGAIPGAGVQDVRGENGPDRRSHDLSVRFLTRDAPRPVELVVAPGTAMPNRPLHRAGDRNQDLEGPGHDVDSPAPV